jgi:hypothetical protein
VSFFPILPVTDCNSFRPCSANPPTRLTTAEWMTALNFLKDVGQKCTPLRHEAILLSDVLGLSSVVDIINNTVPGATQSSVLGPFFTDDAPDRELVFNLSVFGNVC